MKNKFVTLLFLFSSTFLLAQSDGDIRTKGSGIWLLDPIWEVYNAGSWSSTSAASTITTTVTIDHDVSILFANLTISGSGQLIISPTGKLGTNNPITNSVGVNGILVQASSSGSGQFQNKSTVSGTVQTYLTGAKWHLIGSPVDGVDVFTVFDGFYMQQYNEYNNGWIWNDSTGVFIPNMSLGYGYSIWNSTSSNAAVSGSLTASDVLVNLTFSGGAAVDFGFNLLANPYACGIGFTTDWTRVNVNNAIYIWDQDLSGGSYLTYNTGNSYIIRASQGFFMQATATGSVLMKTGARTTGNSLNPMKTTAVEEIKRARLHIKNIANNYGDELQFEFNDIASLNYNGETDASKMYGSEVSPDLFLLTEDDIPVAVAIKGLDANQISTLRMQLRPNVDATYRITASEFTFDPATEVLLEDLFTTNEPMIVDATLDYTFSSLATDDESRFVIYVRPAVTGIDTPDAESLFTAFGSKDQLRILTNESNYKLSVYNLLGQMLVEKNNLEGNASIDLSAFKQSIVLVNIQSENEIISKKIQLK